MQYGLKHFGVLSALILMVFSILVEPITRFIYAAVKDSLGECDQIFEGYLRYLKSVPVILSSFGK